MYRMLILLLVTALTISCGTDAKQTNNETVGKAEYRIIVTGDHETMLVGDNVDSQWTPENGYVYLGTDDVNEPLGTLTMSIGDQTGEENLKEYFVVTALLSKTDVRVGTAEEANARLFELVEGTITNVEIGNNFIRGSLGLKMERVLSWPQDEPESVNVIGTFTAKTK